MIEDNHADIAGIIDYCDEKNWECDVKSFDDGLSFIKENDPDIVILDLQDKEEDGFTGRNIIKQIGKKILDPSVYFLDT